MSRVSGRRGVGTFSERVHVHVTGVQWTLRSVYSNALLFYFSSKRLRHVGTLLERVNDSSEKNTWPSKRSDTHPLETFPIASWASRHSDMQGHTCDLSV